MSSHIILALYLRKKFIHLSSSMKGTWSILSICYSLSYLKCCWVKQDSGVRIQLLKKKKKNPKTTWFRSIQQNVFFAL